MNAAGSGTELITNERFFQVIGTPCRLPVPGKIMLPGTGMLESVPTDQRHCFQNAAPIRIWTELRVQDVCSLRMFLREFRRAMASRAASFPTGHLLSGPPLFGTLSAQRPGNDIAKHIIRRHGRADAGSAYRFVWSGWLLQKSGAYQRTNRWGQLYDEPN